MTSCEYKIEHFLQKLSKKRTYHNNYTKKLQKIRHVK